MKRIAVTAYLLTTLNAAAQVEINSFHSDGMLTWTNPETPAVCHVEWASNLTSGWFRSWADLTDILVTDTSHSAAVPMFYRVVCEPADFQDGLALYLPFDAKTDDSTAKGTGKVNTGPTLTTDAQVEITSFDSNGTLTWTNSKTPAVCHIEWASNLTSGWFRSWANLTDILVTDAPHSVPVPMFYRVACETADFQDGLALYLPLDGNTDDSSTNETDGINTGATLTTDRSGNPANAYFFDGTGTEVYVPDTSSLDVTNITLSCWLHLASYSTARELVNKFGANGDIAYGTEIDAGGILYFRISTDGRTATLTDLASITRVATATWYHFAGTYDGSEMRLYINGNLDSSTPKSGEIFNSSSALRIGRYGYFSGWKYHGTVDEVALWNRALTETEIRLLYLNGGKP